MISFLYWKLLLANGYWQVWKPAQIGGLPAGVSIVFNTAHCWVCIWWFCQHQKPRLRRRALVGLFHLFEIHFEAVTEHRADGYHGLWTSNGQNSLNICILSQKKNKLRCLRELVLWKLMANKDLSVNWVEIPRVAINIPLELPLLIFFFSFYCCGYPILHSDRTIWEHQRAGWVLGSGVGGSGWLPRPTPEPWGSRTREEK